MPVLGIKGTNQRFHARASGIWGSLGNGKEHNHSEANLLLCGDVVPKHEGRGCYNHRVLWQKWCKMARKT